MLASRLPALVLASLLALTGSSVTDDGPGGGSDGWLAAVNAENDGDAVTVSGTRTTPGTHADESSDRAGGTDRTGSKTITDTTESTRASGSRHATDSGHTTDAASDVPTYDAPDHRIRVAVDCVSQSIPCELNAPEPTQTPTPPPETPEPSEPPETVEHTTPTITIEDLAVFHPTPPEITSEPDHTGVVGLPTNITAAAQPQTLRGTVLGIPITVRFTPDGYTFDYGDGSTLTTPTGGATWTDTGDPQFTPTPTSHTYADTGDYTATTTVAYAAQVSYGDGTGWHDIAGHITVTSATQSIHIYRAHTALVAHTCAEDPTGPGC